MEQVAHQAIVMQFILNLAQTLKVDPRGCFRQFFSQIKVCTEQDVLSRIRAVNLGKDISLGIFVGIWPFKRLRVHVRLQTSHTKTPSTMSWIC